MKTNIYILFLLLWAMLAACSQDTGDDAGGSPEDGPPPKDVILVRMGDGSEATDVANRLYKNIPSTWHIGKKSILPYDQIQGDKEARLNELVKDNSIYLTVIVDIDDIQSGKYQISLFENLKYYKRDFYVIATNENPGLQKAMLGLIGVYQAPGYYGINYDNLQRYRIFPAADPAAKDHMIGAGMVSFAHNILASSTGKDNGTDPDDPDEMYNAQMADKEALKHIEIYDRMYGYAKGDGMDYSVETAEYMMKEGKSPDITIDNHWTIDAYNFQIYSKNNNCIVSVYNSAGSGFSCNVKDYTTPKSANVYAYIWNLMTEASSEVTVHADGNVFREISYQPQTVNHGTTYSESSSWRVSVGVSPFKMDKPWEAFKASFAKESSTSISYKTATMDLASKGQMGDGLYSKQWQFVPGQFYDKQPAFVYETSDNLRVIDAVQAMTPNYVTWGGWTLRQDYQKHINNSMSLFQQQCIYTLSSDSNPGVISVAIKDGVKLQKTEVHYNCGIRYGHQSSNAGMNVTKMVLIDFGQWDR